MIWLAFIILTVLALTAVAYAAFVWSHVSDLTSAAEVVAERRHDAFVDLTERVAAQQREFLAQMLHHVEKLTDAHATERERLLTAALRGENLADLQRREVAARSADARSEFAAIMAQVEHERRLGEMEDDRRYEIPGGLS